MYSAKAIMRRVVLNPAGGSNINTETITVVTYGQCQKNQAARLGKQALDGCGEFMSSGAQGTAALTCAACGCNRSDHKEEITTVQVTVQA